MAWSAAARPRGGQSRRETRARLTGEALSLIYGKSGKWSRDAAVVSPQVASGVTMESAA